MDWEFAQVRVTATTNPISLGDSFREALHKTWTPAGPPETQPVICTLTSPTGKLHELRAKYDGNFNWVAELPADELGRWSYSWSHSLENASYESRRGIFDVVTDDNSTAALAHAARALVKELRSREPGKGPTFAQRTRFARLQRAFLQMQTPETFRTEGFDKIDRLINEMRKALGANRAPAYEAPSDK